MLKDSKEAAVNKEKTPREQQSKERDVDFELLKVIKSSITLRKAEQKCKC